MPCFRFTAIAFIVSVRCFADPGDKNKPDLRRLFINAQYERNKTQATMLSVLSFNVTIAWGGIVPRPLAHKILAIDEIT